MKIPFMGSSTKRLPEILASFNQTKQELSVLISANDKTVEDNVERIKSIEEQNAELAIETNTAAKVLSNINNLLGEPQAKQE
jgi:hypothetical protein